jgi:hypothetical protein
VRALLDAALSIPLVRVALASDGRQRLSAQVDLGNQWSANRPSRTVMAASALRTTLALPGLYKGREDTPASRPRQPP